MGAGSEGGFRLDLDPRAWLEFHGSRIRSDGGLLFYRKLDGALGLFNTAVTSLRDPRKGKTGNQALMGLARLSAFGRLAGCEDVSDAERC